MLFRDKVNICRKQKRKGEVEIKKLEKQIATKRKKLGEKLCKTICVLQKKITLFLGSASDLGVTTNQRSGFYLFHLLKRISSKSAFCCPFGLKQIIVYFCAGKALMSIVVVFSSNVFTSSLK